MALRVVSSSPKPEDFTPLSDHQSETPTTFFGGKPVLYAHHAGLTLSIPRSKLQDNPAIAKFAVAPDFTDPENAIIKDIEVWVNSR